MSFLKDIAKMVGKAALTAASEGVQQAQKQGAQRAMQSNERYGNKTLSE